MPPRAIKRSPVPNPETEPGIPEFLRDADTSSESSEADNSIPLEYLQAEPTFVTVDDEVTPASDTGATVDAQVRVETDDLNTAPFGNRRRKDESKAKTGPPTADEWQDFFARIVIRFMTEWYVDFVFRGIDEDLVTDNDAAKLLLTEDERNVIARPFAEFANKSPFLRKHGRQVVAFADSFESIVILGQWFTRVNRIARKYARIVRKPTVQAQPEEKYDVNFEQSQARSNGHKSPGIPDNIVLHNPGSG